jgi:hypothetical protein
MMMIVIHQFLEMFSKGLIKWSMIVQKQGLDLPLVVVAEMANKNHDQL